MKTHEFPHLLEHHRSTTMAGFADCILRRNPIRALFDDTGICSTRLNGLNDFYYRRHNGRRRFDELWKRMYT